MSNQNNHRDENNSSFFILINNTIVKITALIGATTTLLIVLNEIGIIGNSPKSPPQAPKVSTPLLDRCIAEGVTEEIKFNPNSFDKIIRGCVSQDNSDTYYLDALQNQKFFVKITKGDLSILVTASNHQLLGKINKVTPSLLAKLPSDGKVEVVVKSENEIPQDYNIFFEIR